MYFSICISRNLSFRLKESFLIKKSFERAILILPLYRYGELHAIEIALLIVTLKGN